MTNQLVNVLISVVLCALGAASCWSTYRAGRARGEYKGLMSTIERYQKDSTSPFDIQIDLMKAVREGLLALEEIKPSLNETDRNYLNQVAVAAINAHNQSFQSLTTKDWIKNCE